MSQRKVMTIMWLIILAMTLVVIANSPSEGTTYGASYAKAKHPSEAHWAGKAKIARIFDPNALDDWGDYPAAERAYDDGVRRFSFSWKGTDEQDIIDFARTIPNDAKVFGTYYHEPENDIESGILTLNQWKNRFTEQSIVMRSVGIVPTRILMGWSLYPKASGQDVADYDLAPGVVAVSAFDGHLSSVKTPRGFARKLKAERARTGLPMAVPETWGTVEEITLFRRLIDRKVRWACWFTPKGLSRAQAKAWF